jgi:hypothetical protein
MPESASKALAVTCTVPLIGLGAVTVTVGAVLSTTTSSCSSVTTVVVPVPRVETTRTS